MKKISIIIPVYNVEDYISACLESVVCQDVISFDDYEVIVINDGSPDKSIDIINSFDWKECNHKVISQPNRGLGGARNSGLKYVSGDYVWFVDSDDIIAKNAVRLILEKANGCDMINIAHCRLINGVKGNTVSCTSASSGIGCLRKGFHQEAQFHIFKRTLLLDNNIIFKEGIYHEDAEFTPRCLFLSKSIETISDCIYYYRIRSGSIMATINTKRAFDNLIVACSLLKFCQEHQVPLNDNPMLNTICLCLNNALFIISQATKEKQKEWVVEFNSKSELCKALMNSKVLKYKLEGYLFKILPINKIVIYNFLTKLR